MSILLRSHTRDKKYGVEIPLTFSPMPRECQFDLKCKNILVAGEYFTNVNVPPHQDHSRVDGRPRSKSVSWDFVPCTLPTPQCCSEQQATSQLADVVFGFLFWPNCFAFSFIVVNSFAN